MKKPFLMSFENEVLDLNSKGGDIDFRNNMRKLFKDELKIDNNQDTLLILTRIHDTEINYIGPILAKNDINYIRIDADYFLQDLTVTVKIINGELNSFLSYKGEEINLANIKLIWNRHFDEEAFNFIHQNEIVKKFIENEWNSLLSFLYQYPQIQWINNPFDVVKASKLQQLITANEVGFSILDTILTNDPNQVELLVSKKTSLFCKAAYHHFIEQPSGILNSVYGKKFKNSDMQYLDSLKYCPVIFQEFAPNLEEVRVTVIENQFYAAKYINKINDDWHNDDMENVELIEIEVPSSIKSKCLDMLNKLNLQYGAFDFFKTINGDWIFIEVNQLGDWRWLEVKTKQDITNSFVKYIKNRMSEGEKIEIKTF